MVFRNVFLQGVEDSDLATCFVGPCHRSLAASVQDDDFVGADCRAIVWLIYARIQ